MEHFFKFADNHPWIARSMVAGLVTGAVTLITNVSRAVTGNYPPARDNADLVEAVDKLKEIVATMASVDADNDTVDVEEPTEDSSEEPIAEEVNLA